ncbi:hypothetical protein HUT11_35770 (plasmid) [Streptomyces seoulensis]|nr:hypothetical protein HUT11_35770 [Streptomyces seoulensis]
MPGLDAALTGVIAWIGDNLLIDTIRIQLPTTEEPVLNPDTGELTRPAGEVLYEGPGAVQSTAQTALSSSPAALQPWTLETTSRFQLLTPLTAPIPPKDALITVVQVHNPANTALIGRSWVCQDPGRAATIEVVRVTPLDMLQDRGDTE